MEKLEDEILMSKVKAGDLDVLQILFDRHHKHIFNFLYKMCGDRIHSEDITQEVFYNVMRYRSSYNHGRFLPWLFTIARNSMKRHFRARTEHEEIEAAQNRTIEQEEQKDYSKLHLALNKLSPSDKEVIVLSRFQDMKYADLAEVIGSTEGAVKSKVSRALKKLKVIYLQNN